MKKIAEILLCRFLRRYPVPTRLSLFTHLHQYSWLKDVLEELRPELFPENRDLTATEITTADPTPDDRVLSLLKRSEIQGRLGYYKIETYLGSRGNGHLFSGIDITSKRPVVIKEFLLPQASFTKANAHQRQNSFQRLSGLQLSDGRVQDFRIIPPIEAIADTESQERCFLVTDARDRSPTLRQYLQTQGALPSAQVREVLNQLLQSLHFLHRQKFSLPSGAVQNGLVHGNLSLDSILWAEHPSQPFVYLCDLWLWEQWFDGPSQERRSIQVTADTLQQELRAVGEIGVTLLQGLQPQPIAVITSKGELLSIDPPLQSVLDGLQTGRFENAETARQALLQLSPRSPAVSLLQDERSDAAQSRQWLSLLLLLSLLGLAAGAFLLFLKLRSTQSQSALASPVSTCCLSEVSAVPAGEYTYTAIEGGIWWSVLKQRNLLQQGESLMGALQTAQPKLRLQYVPAASLEEVLAQVRSGAVDFAVLPQINDLPGDVLAQEIAYDGLAAVVSFSYAKRQQGLPTALNGQLTLEQLRHLYTGEIDQWQALGRSSLSRIGRYVARNPEAIALFERQVLQSKTLKALPTVRSLPPLDLLRQVIRDFEDSSKGSIGIVPLSQTWGQCSVYPLALGDTGKAAVQPIVLNSGQPIDPEIDLCDRKGAYGPDPDRFQAGTYPLSYPIIVVYPRDNRRSTVGKKFAELMRTLQGQRLLRAAGLVPLSQLLPSPASPPPR